MASIAAVSCPIVGEQVSNHAEHKRKRMHQLASPDTEALFSQPLMPYVFGQTIHQYFELLRSNVDIKPFRRVQKNGMLVDGLYLHKRPLNMDQTNKGTVTHHVVLYLKQGQKLHSIDFGPDNGADVTTNIFANHPARKVLSRDTQIPEQDKLPLMFIGQPDLPLDYDLVTKAFQFAESNLYHALRNNCIHFADFAVRVLTRGKVRGAPFIYDLVCGEVPAQDPPETAMLAMFGMSWFMLCDGSSLTARFLASLEQPTLQHSHSVTDLPSKRQEASLASQPISDVAAKDPNTPEHEARLSDRVAASEGDVFTKLANSSSTDSLASTDTQEAVPSN